MGKDAIALKGAMESSYYIHLIACSKHTFLGLNLKQRTCLRNNTYTVELSKWHKLDNVSNSSFSWTWPQSSTVTVQKFHGTEISTSNTNNNDGHWKLRGIDNSRSGFIKVCYHPIRDYQKYKILLLNKSTLLKLTRKIYSQR